MVRSICLYLLSVILLPGADRFARHDPAQSGLDFINPFLSDHPQGFLYDSPFGCGGIAAGDVNGDGLPDLFFTNGPSPNALYLNQGGWKFTKAPLVEAGNKWSTGATLVDIDADGDLDLHLCNYLSANEIWLNDGTGKFVEEVAKDWGLDQTGPSLMASFCDYDRDGDLDVFLISHREYYPHRLYKGEPLIYVDGKQQVAPGFEKWFALQNPGGSAEVVGQYGHPNRLLQQESKDGEAPRFIEVSAKAGIAGYGHSLSALWWDFDGDGWMDLYESNDYGDPDRLYRNERNGTFALVTERFLPSVPWFSMGAAAADVNNDGRLDLFAADMAPTTHLKAKIAMGDMGSQRSLLENGQPRQAMRNHLFVNSAGGHFLETAYQSGVAATDWTWTPCLADLDLDGRVDLFVSNGMARFFSDADSPSVGRGYAHQGWEAMKEEPPLREKNLAYRNLGKLEFENVSKSWGLDQATMSYAAVTVDLDRDGDLDLVTSDLGDPIGLYENQTTEGHWLQVRLRGEGRNSSGLGATVTIRTKEGAQHVRQIAPVSGFLSCGEAIAHFGLGSTETVASLEVRWPSGMLSRVSEISADQTVVLTEMDSFKATPLITPLPLLRQLADGDGLAFVHRERPFDDYALQPLLPGKLSQFGPGAAVGDVDGDGREDVYLGGAAGQPGALYRWKKDGFVLQTGPWEKEAEGEDVAAVFFDADGDGDLDLIVARGSVEHERGALPLRDLLYRNNGKGQFDSDHDALPPFMENSSVVAVHDWDGDGRPDLFIGSRVKRGEYPRSAPSRLLQNKSEKDRIRFEDVTKTLAPELQEVGMVTGAVWVALDDDPEDELVLSQEWGGLLIFDRQDGRLVKRKSTLNQETGWWNGLVACDVDGDGDQDLLGLNTGWNTKYGRPHRQKPAILYHGPMEPGGDFRLVEAKSDGANLLPVRGRSCSAGAIPWIADEFRSYRHFAESSLQEIYTLETLQGAQRHEAATLTSGIFLNEGNFQFRFKAFPAVAQLAPIYDIAAGDWTGDGNVDLLLAQGFSGREPETGLWRGSPGVMLEGIGKGDFRALDASVSGFLVPGDGRQLKVLRAGKQLRVLAIRNDAKTLMFAPQ